MTTVEVPVGAKVSVSSGVGYVRWTGSNPKFSAGKWVGIELLEATGKNDGTVKGERYFECKPAHGVFVRPSQVNVLEQPKVVAARTSSVRPPPTPIGSKPSSTSATSNSSPKKPSSRAGPSTPTRTTSRTSASTSSPPIISRQISGASSSDPTPRPPAINTFKRPDSPSEPTPIATRQARPLSSLAIPNDETSERLVSPAPVTRRVASPLGSGAEALPAFRLQPTRSFSSALAPRLPPESSTLQSSATIAVKADSSLTTESSAIGFTSKRELEELRIKIRILENRKTEDQERIRSLEAKVGEADTLRAARVKLQAKFQEIQSSLVAAQRQARDLASENVLLETRATEATDQLEMAALDREVAEEKAEAADLEVVKLAERISEMELEVALLKEENAEYEKPVGAIEGERASAAFVQLEKHNERLKEALIRLRDVSAEAERDHKAKLAEIDKELSLHKPLVGRLKLSNAKLRNAEEQVEDLKLQLDDALGAEDMLEQLTERNLQLGERIEEMRVSIEDLEALKELNDELEENHIGAEKQLHQDVSALSALLREEKQRSSNLDAVIVDMEGTIEQFRNLVADLQAEINDLRIQQQTQEVMSASTSKEGQTLMNLNLKLQSSAARMQSKTVELELKKIEAAQLAEHMRIITAYLPEPYHEAEADSTAVLLFFHRIASKIDMLINIISQIHGLPSALHTASSELLVGVCELRGKLRYFSTLNKRFGAIISRSTPEDWLTYGKVLRELGGVEQRVDGWIDLIKVDEFKEGDCARNLASLIAQFDHLAESNFRQIDLGIGEHQLGLAYSFDYDLDNFAAAIGFARHAVVRLTDEEDIEIETGDSTLDHSIYEPVTRLLDSVRALKVPSSKLVKQVGELVQKSTALLPEMTTELDHLSISVSNAVDRAVQLAQRIGAHMTSLRTSKQPLRLNEIDAFMQDVTADICASSDGQPWETLDSLVLNLSKKVAIILTKISKAWKSGQTVSINVPPPWLSRVASIKEAASHNVDSERKLARLSEEAKDMLREIKLRDQNLQESGVKVEMLERRLESSRKQGEVIIELEKDVAKAKKQEKVYGDAIEQLQAEQDVLEAENAKLRKGQGGDKPLHGDAFSGREGLSMTIGGLELSQLAEQVANLRSAVRFLRSENAMLKSKDLYNDLHLLPALARRVEAPLPELDPSSPLSSPSSSTCTDLLPITPTRHALVTESKLLFREIATFQSSPKIVDISGLGKKAGWQSRKNSPEQQVWGWKVEERRLERKVERLAERTQDFRSREL